MWRSHLPSWLWDWYLRQQCESVKDRHASFKARPSVLPWLRLALLLAVAVCKMRNLGTESWVGRNVGRMEEKFREGTTWSKYILLILWYGGASFGTTLALTFNSSPRKVVRMKWEIMKSPPKNYPSTTLRRAHIKHSFKFLNSCWNSMLGTHSSTGRQEAVCLRSWEMCLRSVVDKPAISNSQNFDTDSDFNMPEAQPTERLKLDYFRKGEVG